MRIGPGKHMHGVSLMDGVMMGEDYDVRKHAWFPKVLSLTAF